MLGVTTAEAGVARSIALTRPAADAARRIRIFFTVVVNDRPGQWPRIPPIGGSRVVLENDFSLRPLRQITRSRSDNHVLLQGLIEDIHSTCRDRDQRSVAAVLGKPFGASDRGARE